MKTAFVIDFLLERSPDVFLLELLLAGEEEADIYCLAHAPGRLQGVVERHRIHASPLSRFVRTPEDLPSRAWLIPSAARQLQVDPSVERLVIISNGWGHVIPSDPRTERFVWMRQWSDPATRLKGIKRIFGLHHEEVKRRALRAEKHVVFSSQTLAQRLGFPQGQVIAPGFKTDDYVMVPDESHPGLYPHHVVLLEGAAPADVRVLLKAAKAQNVPLKLLGRDEAFAYEKALADPLWDFVGDHCAATTAAFTHGARALWALGETIFPLSALGAWCGGRPAVVFDSPVNREFLQGQGAWFCRGGGEIPGILAQVEKDYLGFDRKTLRRQGLKWNERLFKTQLRSWAGLKVLSSRPE